MSAREWFSPHGTTWVAESYTDALEAERDALHAENEHLRAALDDQFAWIKREASGDCDPDRIIRACDNAIDSLAARDGDAT